MFSLQLEFNLKACAKLPLVQHLVGLAAVQAINTHRPEAELKLKWPNDVYTSQGIKLGGVVVYSSIFRDKVQLDIGMGLNLNNAEPTVCLNTLLDQPVTREEYLAWTFNSLERFLDAIKSEEELDKVIDLYHDNWLHSGQRVTIQDGDSKCEGVVRSIDRDGFLQVETGSVIRTVHPDGNSFDMMQGLIVPKNTH